LHLIGLSTGFQFGAACFFTGAALMGLGAYKALFHDKNYVRSALETLILGSACAAVAFLVGRAVASFGMDSDLFTYS